MATVINKRDAALQAASPRVANVNLGTNIVVNGDVTGTLDGTDVTAVVNAALSATANYFTTSASDPTGGSDGDAHYNSTTNVMWFKISGTWTRGGTINANAITAGTLAAARIAAGSITADKFSVSSLSAISADLGTVTTGAITGTSSITITGQSTFRGVVSSDSTTWAVVCNEGKSSTGGVIGWAGSAGAGVRGNCTTSLSSARGVEGITASGIGVLGSASSSGVGVRAVSWSGNALEVQGPMTITSSALVSNLRSATCLLADNSTKWGGYTGAGTSTGSSTAAFNTTNKPGSNSTNVWFTITNGTTTVRWPVWT